MQNLAPELSIFGLPTGVSKEATAILKSRIYRLVNNFAYENNLQEANILIGSKDLMNRVITQSRPVMTPRSGEDDTSTEVMARKYVSTEPRCSYDNLILPDQTMADIVAGVSVIKIAHKVFEEWGLRKIEPYPRTALNFHGPSGTGKTLAAHGIASYLGKKIILGSYADIESKYHGDGPKNVEAIFYAAERDDAVLFIDEAESLLSKRLLNVTQGSESAINSMRSQLLICMERFKGVVIFATNLVQSYDSAFETRVRDIYFPLPDEECRRKIWMVHLPATLPLSNDVSADRLAREVPDINGRDIRNAVIDAATRVALNGSAEVGMNDLLSSVERLRQARERGRPGKDEPAVGAEINQHDQQIREGVLKRLAGLTAAAA